jgi:nucleotide-binding universal stress UspA family protein
MYRSIVVPLDGSVASEHVLPLAVQIARSSHATLRQVYVPGPDDASMLEDGLPLDIALPARSITCAQAYLKQIRLHSGCVFLGRWHMEARSRAG